MLATWHLVGLTCVDFSFTHILVNFTQIYFTQVPTSKYTGQWIYPAPKSVTSAKETQEKHQERRSSGTKALTYDQVANRYCANSNWSLIKGLNKYSIFDENFKS